MGWKAWVVLGMLLLAARPALADSVIPHPCLRLDRGGRARLMANSSPPSALSDCRTVDTCLHDQANLFRASDPREWFRSDCADLPYVLRFYYAWKRGLPFSYVSDVSPRGHARDIRYSPRGNEVEARTRRHDRRRCAGDAG